MKRQLLIIPEVWQQRRKAAPLILNKICLLGHDKLFWGFLHFLYCICTILFMSKLPQVAIAVPKRVSYCIREIRRCLHTLEKRKSAGFWPRRMPSYIKKTPREPEETVRRLSVGSLVEGQRLMVTNQGPAENPLDSRQMRHWQKQFSGTILRPNWRRSLFEMVMCCKIWPKEFWS